MFGIMSINWKNTAENLIIVLISFVAGAFLGYKISIAVTDSMIEGFKPILEKAIDKETIKNEIKNEIQIRDNKFKKNDSLNINIKQIPDNKQHPENVIIKNPDTTTEKKKGFFGRLFSKKE